MLLLGLEFALAADLIGSIVSPTWEDIGQLGDLENAERTQEA
jgi:uncharacterized membrane protein